MWHKEELEKLEAKEGSDLPLLVLKMEGASNIFL